jgi:SNF2 family DNA or RNA helicase
MFEESSWDMVVFDESQTLKNPDSQVTRAAMRLGGAFKLALTGTPLENNLLDLWSQFRCILPGLLPSREDFAGLCDRNPEQAVLLAKGRIRPFLLRRLKRDVLSELPAKTESILRVELNESELETYRAMLLATRRELLAEAGSEVSVMEVLEAILRLRQACCDPRLLDPISSTEASTKIQFLGDRLVELIEAGHRCLVFSQWTTYLDLIEPELTKRSIEFSRLDGTTRDRGAIVSSFQADDGPPVMLLSLKAGGVGLTLTAADHVFLMDPWWNPAVEEQAADRAHRIGQKDPVFVHRIIAQDTIEERILELQERKRSLASALLSDGDGGLRITKEELLELIG